MLDYLNEILTNLAFFIAVLPVIAVSLLLLIIPDVVSFRAQRKGYRSPWLLLLIWISPLAGYILDFYFNPERWHENIRSIADAWLLPVPLLPGIAISTLTILVLPHRSIRLAGVRRVSFPFEPLAHLIWIGTLLIALRSWLSSSIEWWGVIAAAAGGITLAGIVFSYGNRLKSRTLWEVLKDDPRPPVLYLRSFDQEGLIFAHIAPWQQEKQFAIAINQYGQKLEEYLADELTSQIGPFVALGNPEDILPPVGAARVYGNDDDWQDYFKDLARRSAFVLMQISDSFNLKWELQTIRQEGWQTKLFVVTPPRRPKGPISWYVAICRFTLGLANWMKGQRTASWASFVGHLRDVGYSVPITDPGPGSVIGFGPQANGTVLTIGALKPAEFVTPIRSYLG